MVGEFGEFRVGSAYVSELRRSEFGEVGLIFIVRRNGANNDNTRSWAVSTHMDIEP
jgi:hypothetical protein